MRKNGLLKLSAPKRHAATDLFDPRTALQQIEADQMLHAAQDIVGHRNVADRRVAAVSSAQPSAGAQAVDSTFGGEPGGRGVVADLARTAFDQPELVLAQNETFRRIDV